MAHNYAKLMFTDAVKHLQEENGSRKSYARTETDEHHNNVFGVKEIQFLINADSFYMASVNENGWPYVQHRGGPKGFVKIVDENVIAFADYAGNKQYISAGNFRTNNQVSLFFMDYRNKRRLKMVGRIQTVDESDINLLNKLEPVGYRARVERGYLVSVLGFDWNCPQHITPRYTREEIQPLIDTLAYYQDDTENAENILNQAG